MPALPRYLEKYFWDVDFASLEPVRQARFIIGRLLEHGDRKAVLWMSRQYSKPRVAAVMRSMRELSERSAHFWCVVLGVDKKSVRCLKKRFLETRRRFWPY